MTHVMPQPHLLPGAGWRCPAFRHMATAFTALLMLACLPTAATAQASQPARTARPTPAQAAHDGDTATRRQQAAIKHVNDAVGVVQTMRADAGMPALLGRSRGAFIVPTYGRAALFGSAVTVGINDVRFSQRLTEAYAGKPVTAQQALDSTVTDARSDALRQPLGDSPPTSAAGTGKPAGH